MSTPIPHFRNFKGHGYDPGQNSWFEFSIADFNFQIQHLNFTAEFKNLYSSFRIHIIGKRFYPCRLAFELNFFIWPCSRCIFNSLCQITQSNHVIFNSTNKFLHTATFCQFWYLNSTLHLTEMRALHSILFGAFCQSQLNFWIFVNASVRKKKRTWQKITCTYILAEQVWLLPNIEIISCKVLAYGMYARVVDVSEIKRVSAANE